MSYYSYIKKWFRRRRTEVVLDQKRYRITGTLKGLEDGTDENYVITKNCDTLKEITDFMEENRTLVKDWTIQERVGRHFITIQSFN
jgi:hypothetical protein